MSEKNKKIGILTGLADVYGFSFTELSMSLFLGALDDLRAEDLRRIIDFGIKRNLWKYMPRPGEILAVINMSEESSSELNAKKEFQKILDSVRKYGRTVAPNVSETAVIALRQAGGIARIAEASNEDLVWLQKDFDACYELNHDRKKIDTRKAQLKGSLQSAGKLKQLTAEVAGNVKMF